MTVFKHLIISLFCIFNFTIQASEAKPTTCLNMIVKDEKDVIQRCLKSVLPLIDYWVIVDTGSTDGTQEIIKNYMKEQGVPGELFERPWKNFEYNRNEAINLAKGKADYLLFIDADEYLVFEPDFQLPKFDKDFYYITILHGGTKYPRIQLVNNHLDWKYRGVLHEIIYPSPDRSSDIVGKVQNIYTTEGARSKDPEKYLKDAQILEAALKEEPHNSRYVFYLAKSYMDAGKYELAQQNYEKRIAMGGWDEEVFWAMYQVALVNDILNKPREEVVKSYLATYKYRNSRVEPIHDLARYFREKKEYQLGYEMAKLGQTIPRSSDLLFRQEWMHDYGLALERSVCAYWIEKYDECQQISLELLKRTDLPANVRICIQNNLGFANSKLAEKICMSTLE